MPPFSSVEVRWFFAGDGGDREAVRTWFEECSPLDRSADAGCIEWAARQGDEPDTYLLLPGYEDMGIKWREGTLQVKGLVADVGDSSYGARHAGHVQRWIKWTYARVPENLQAIFKLATAGVVPVRKLRAVRLVEILPSGEFIEVPGSRRVRQGVAFEMVELEVGDRRSFTIAFEAFPDSASLRACFDDVVGLFLQGLERPGMALDRSCSYPAWLNRELT